MSLVAIWAIFPRYATTAESIPAFRCWDGPVVPLFGHPMSAA